MGASKAEDNLYPILTQLLKKARDDGSPITSVEAYDNNTVRKIAESVNKVSDTLGHLYRRGYIDRTPAPKTPNNQSRYAYAWKPEESKNKKLLERSVAMGATSGNGDRSTGTDDRTVVVSRPKLEVSEDGDVITIDLPALQITIRTTVR